MAKKSRPVGKQAPVPVREGGEVMELGKLGVWFFQDAMTAEQTRDFARQAERLGYGALWVPEAVGREPLAHCGYLLANTERLVLATGIANIWARDAMTMNAGARTLAELSGGRFVLGIGVSHQHLLRVRGHEYSRPYSYMRDYLARMKNSLYMAAPPKEDPPLVLAALFPRMLALAGSEARGAHTYFVPPEHTAKARSIMGPTAWLCAAQAVILETDPAKARDGARNYMKVYLRAPNYLNMLKDLGFTDEDFAQGGSDRLVDAVVAWGDEDRIRVRIQAQYQAGATHVCILPVRADKSPLPDERAMQALAPR
jgi:probable F420-dependent oxidoreductase